MMRDAEGGGMGYEAHGIYGHKAYTENQVNHHQKLPIGFGKSFFPA